MSDPYNTIGGGSGGIVDESEIGDGGGGCCGCGGCYAPAAGLRPILRGDGGTVGIGDGGTGC